jgi:hypothetical protein
MRAVGYVARIGNVGNAYRIILEYPEGEIPLGKSILG